MKLYSTNNKSHIVDLKTAVLKGLPDDNGLYMPCDIKQMPTDFYENLSQLSFEDIAYQVSHNLVGGSIPDDQLKKITKNTVNFPAPLTLLSDDIAILELYHGPSMAFKDFGARFMSQLMSYFNRGEEEELTILVATSGDTGGAVAAGFYNTPGINVIILYPSGKVSDIQEKQLTTLGKNITALEIDGTFDDCQALVKEAFLDKKLNEHRRLSSANSINIARLIPQSFYYFEAYKQLRPIDKPTVFSIPSGNYGNLTAGIIAKMMGLPISKFLAATNTNDVIPAYLTSGQYQPKPSIPTLSNAMDVGDPSNFKRLADIFGAEGSTWNNMKKFIAGFSFSDRETIEGIKEVYSKYSYQIDPHGAIGYLALLKYQEEHNVCGVVLETAHPSKFKDIMDDSLGFKTTLPKQLHSLLDKEKLAISMGKGYEEFRKYLMA